jgi:hypothetical protein
MKRDIKVTPRKKLRADYKQTKMGLCTYLVDFTKDDEIIFWQSGKMSLNEIFKKLKYEIEWGNYGLPLKTSCWLPTNEIFTKRFDCLNYVNY